MSLVIVLGVVGFAWHFVWIAALVVLGILRGSLAANRQRRSRSGKGVLAEAVNVVVGTGEGRRQLDPVGASQVTER